MGTAVVVYRRHPINPPKPLKKKLQTTICGILRLLYQDAEARGDFLSMHRLDEAHHMAKRMHRKLMQYNKEETLATLFGTDGFDPFAKF